jgi:CrcB protein
MVPKWPHDNRDHGQTQPHESPPHDPQPPGRWRRTALSAVAAIPWLGIAAVSVGAAGGALLRWQLGIWLNGLNPTLPTGTLTANILGGYLVGVAVAFFAHQPEWPPAWRLFVITGFLGGLTTFSTFSAEVVAMLQAGRLQAALVAITAHLAGSLVATLAGLATMEGLRRT